MPAILCTAILLVGCVSQPSLREQLEHVPVKYLEFYDFDPSVPSADRIGEAPKELLELYAAAGEKNLRPYHLGARERRQIADVLSLLPARHQEILNQRLVGIYCVDNFSGSGMADWILGPGDQVYSVLLLHPRVLTMSAAELLTFRLNTAFSPDDSDTTLQVEVSPEVSALAYILLHETTHIVDFAERHTPYVEPAVLELLGPSRNAAPFTEAVWTDYHRLRPSVDFPYADRLRFYGIGEPELAAGDADSVFRALANTPFAFLYASTNWAEDFAEFVTFSYLVRLGAEYRIVVSRRGADVFTLEPMRSPTVTQRIRLVDPDLLRQGQL